MMMTFRLLILFLTPAFSLGNKWENIFTTGFLPRSGFGADVDGDVAFLFGGVNQTDFDDNNGDYYNDLFTFREVGDQRQFTRLVPTGTAFPSPRSECGVAANANYVGVFGGVTKTEVTPDLPVIELASDVSWVYDRADETWKNVTANGPSLRRGAMVFKNGDDFYVLGGVQPPATSGGTPTALKDLWRLKTDTLEWSLLSNNFPVALWNANAVTLGGDVFVYGGYTFENGTLTQQSAMYRNSFATIAQNTWKLINPTGAPNQVRGK